MVQDPASVSEAESTLTAELYLPNENADGFVTEEVSVSEAADPQELVDLLIRRGALPEGSEILNFAQSGKTLNVSMNRAYCDQVSSTGTAGEEMLLGSLVNTLLTFYEADELNLTCEGEILSTGHNDYDFPLSFYENYADEDMDFAG